MMEQKESVGGWLIRECRLKAAIATQRELSRRTGISPSIISDLERGRRQVTPAYANRIAGVVGVKASYLLGEDTGKGGKSRETLYRRKRRPKDRQGHVTG